MTTLFWQKRPSKKLIVTLLLVIMLFSLFVFRRTIAIKSIEHFAKPQVLQITCLEFSFDRRFNLYVEQACIQAPQGSVDIRNGIWQPWSNDLSIEQVKVKHVEQPDTDNNVENAPKTEPLNLPETLPQINIASLEINSYVLLQPLHLGVNTISDNELSITGDVNASVKLKQNTLVGQVDWSLSDLTKWIPQAQQLSQDHAELLTELALDESKIATSFTFDGKLLGAESSLALASSFDISNCMVDATFKGTVIVAVDISSLDINLDLSQLSNDISLANCELIQDYLAEGDIPQLTFKFPQKITINETQINLPKLQIIDTQNTLRSIVLSDLNYKTAGELVVNYNIALEQQIKTKQIQGGMLNFKGAGTLSTDLSALNSQNKQQPISLNITDDNNQLIASDLKIDSLLIGKLTSEFSFEQSDLNQLALKGTINSSDIQTGDLAILKTSSTFSISGASIDDLKLTLDNQLFQLVHVDASVKKITNHLDLSIKDLESLSFSGNSTVTNLTVKKIKILPVNVTHLGQANLADKTVSSQHSLGLESGFTVELAQQQAEVKLQINEQPVSSLHNIITQLEKALIVKQGNLSASIALTLPQEGEQFSAQGKADIQGVSVKYQNYVLNNITYQTPITFDSAGLQLAESTLHIDSIDVGVTLKQLKANVIAQNSVLRLQQVQGEIFNGKFMLADLWLDGRDQQFDINFQNVDLAQVVALQQQPGINITGNIDGDMPFIMNKSGIKIEDGWATSLTGGKLTIVGNPSFDSIKQQQPELALLENLDFTQLKSKVNLDPDGLMFFDFALKGNNPVKKQSVNFNYTHQENIFTLLESIRLVKSVENKIEKKLTQGDKK